MRVAFVAEYPVSPDEIVGGVQAVVRRLATGMAGRAGMDVHAVSFHVGLSRPVDEVLEGVHVHRFPATSRFGNVTFGWEERRRTAAALRRIAPDVAHAHVLGPPALGTADSGVPWVATAHGMQAAEGRTLRGWTNRVRALTYTRMERMSLRGLSHLIVISPYVLEYFGERVNGIRTHAIENPVEDRFFRVSGPGDPRVLLFTGRLIPRKDAGTLLEAVRHLAGSGADLHVRLAGPADDRGYGERLRGQAAVAELDGRVEFLGALPPGELERELERAGLFVLPSRQETAPLAVMEAMAAGRAVVATDVGGTRHLVEDGVSGTLVPPGDPEGLARALGTYLGDPGLAVRHGRAGREIAERRFRLPNVVEATIRVYRHVVADR